MVMGNLPLFLEHSELAHQDIVSYSFGDMDALCARIRKASEPDQERYARKGMQARRRGACEYDVKQRWVVRGACGRCEACSL